MKKTLSILLSVIMLLCSVSIGGINAFADGDKLIPIGKNLYYTFESSTGTLTFSGKGDEWDSGYFLLDDIIEDSSSPLYRKDRNIIKSIVFKEGITGIPSWSFTGCDKLVSLTIPNTVLYIGRGTFTDCTALKSLYIPDSVIEICSEVFAGCKSLEKIRFGKNLKSINKYAFADCKKLKKVKLPKGLEDLGVGAFAYCKSLTSIEIPKKIDAPASELLMGCTNLKKVILPKKTNMVYTNAFRGCKKLKHVYYRGSKKKWKKIGIEKGNKNLKKAKIHYNYKK